MRRTPKLQPHTNSNKKNTLQVRKYSTAPNVAVEKYQNAVKGLSRYNLNVPKEKHNLYVRTYVDKCKEIYEFQGALPYTVFPPTFCLGLNIDNLSNGSLPAMAFLTALSAPAIYSFVKMRQAMNTATLLEDDIQAQEKQLDLKHSVLNLPRCSVSSLDLANIEKYTV